MAERYQSPSSAYGLLHSVTLQLHGPASWKNFRLVVVVTVTKPIKWHLSLQNRDHLYSDKAEIRFAFGYRANLGIEPRDSCSWLVHTTGICRTISKGTSCGCQSSIGQREG